MEKGVWISKIKLFTNESLVYGQKLVNSIAQAILLFIVVVVVYVGLLHLVNMSWSTYTATQIGKAFVASFENQTKFIGDILSRDLLFFSVEVTATSFVICLAIGIAARFFHISRIFFDPNGIFGRIIFCGLPITAAVAMRIYYVYEFDYWLGAYFVSLIPTLLLFSGCFSFASNLIPEIGELPYLIKGS